jgi:NTP pyrophosphatase (non-canonical NTP hydrolase)
VTDDINIASAKEIELQELYGYSIDVKEYKNLNIKIMNINTTSLTTTFNCAKKDLAPFLKKIKGESFYTANGKYIIDDELTLWILDNAQTSMFRDTCCYVYNKPLEEYIKEGTATKSTAKINTALREREVKEFKQITESYYLFNDIREWAQERGIYDKGDSKTQYVKLMEESGELARAILKEDRVELIDAIGDMTVVLTNLARLNNISIEECIESAYNVINKRKGKMVNGTFVKQETL